MRILSAKQTKFLWDFFLVRTHITTEGCLAAKDTEEERSAGMTVMPSRQADVTAAGESDLFALGK